MATKAQLSGAICNATNRVRMKGQTTAAAEREAWLGIKLQQWRECRQQQQLEAAQRKRRNFASSPLEVIKSSTMPVYDHKHPSD